MTYNIWKIAIELTSVGLAHAHPNYHGIWYYAICRDDSKKNGGYIKSPKWHARNVYVRLVQGLNEPDQSAFMSNGTINFTGQNFTKAPEQLLTKTGKSSDFLSSLIPSQASTIMAETVTLIQAWKKKHKSTGIALTTYRYHRTRTVLQWFSSTPMLKCLVLYVRHFARITLLIASTPLGSSTENVFRFRKGEI